MDTDRAWRAWGENDPYFGVLTDERFRRGRIDANREEFFASGVGDIDRFVARYERSFGPLPGGCALDFGCGVGRLSLALAARYDSVVALDIAPAMLAEARANAARLAKSNVMFAASDAELTNAPGKFDFVNSYIVLQHIPTSRGLPLLRNLVGKVRPGGGCMLHLSISRKAPFGTRVAYWARVNVPLANEAMNLLRGRPVSTPMMQMNEYPLPAVLQIFHDSGIRDVLVSTEDHAGVLTVALTARRPA